MRRIPLRHAHAPARRTWLAALVAALVLALPLVPATAAAHGKAKGHDRFPGRGKTFDTMTRNLYLGADLNPAIGVRSPGELVAAAGQILREVDHNDFPVRAEGLAGEILEKKPDLVGLQEAALWQTAPTTDPGASTVRYDYLQELLAELNRSGPRYELVVVEPEFDFSAPADENEIADDGPPVPGLEDAEIVGHLTMRDAILARRGAGVQTWNEQGGHFATLLEVPVLSETLPVLRGWTATDAKVRGSHPFRFVDTHLEAFHPLVRAAQAGELVAPGGPATSDLPVVLVGDLNSDSEEGTGTPPDSLAYEVLRGAGMVERSTNDPLGCCLGRSLLGEGDGGSVADFNHQVDHIMTRDPEQVLLHHSSVTGLYPVNGFWDSDHAGLFSALRFQTH
jgi:Endonuclease/Exonuclease/phosphatase family